MQTKPTFTMKTKILSIIIPVLIMTFIFSCKKENGTNDEIETTFKLSEDQAVSEELADDANTVFFEVAASNGLLSGRTSQVLQSTNTLVCATVNITPSGSFPKTITIDFGSGCTSPDGITRKGVITIVLSDSVHIPGATATMTFNNYFVQDFKVEGTITWVNTTTAAGFGWTRTIENGKVTSPNGNYYWLHAGVKEVVQTAGSNTPLNLLDDVFSITGNHTVTNPAGKSRTVTIIEALEKKTICHNISKGKVKIEGPAHFAILDYGDGTCDKVATISIDGFSPRTILLP